MDADIAIEQDEVFEVEEETEATGAAAKSRAQVLSPEDRKAELCARFARAPARVRQLQKETEIDPESLVRDHAKKRLATLVKSGIMTYREVNAWLSENNSVEYIIDDRQAVRDDRTGDEVRGNDLGYRLPVGGS